MAQLIRSKEEFFNSINVMLDYYDKFMIKHNYSKQLAREELFVMFKDYHNWLQGKRK